MGGFSGNLIADDEAFPNGINCCRIGQENKHTFEPRQFRRGIFDRQSQTVLGSWARRDHPQFHKVLGNDVELLLARGESLDCHPRYFTLRREGCKSRVNMLVSRSKT